MMEEMCPLFEEFCAIIGCDPNAPLVKHEVKIGLASVILGFTFWADHRMVRPLPNPVRGGLSAARSSLAYQLVRGPLCSLIRFSRSWFLGLGSEIIIWSGPCLILPVFRLPLSIEPGLQARLDRV
ncbi:hypothetical protein JCGZ_18173 [Jatropha curcas]|uniref:Uncharacterized protein n=1 Tax=Jatropha curcas TaxID=180498 RepID=A0A067LE67_JATCU|nr:hypothetical protein JCGZ_18173 [Jatropha curcas]